jgi:hypothetical protein
MKHIYVKNFENNQCVKYSCNTFPYNLSYVIPSKFQWDLLVETMTNNNKIDNTFILCPTYDLKNGTIPDYQISITGSPRVDESPRDTIFRELGEEVGLIPNSDLDIHIFGKFQTRYALINIKDTMPVTECPIYKESEDNKNMKISAVVYGNIEDMMSYCSDDITRYYDPEEHEKLTSVSIVPLSHILVKMKYKYKKKNNKR